MFSNNKFVECTWKNITRVIGAVKRVAIMKFILIVGKIISSSYAFFYNCVYYFYLRKGTKQENCCPCLVQSVLLDGEPPWSECTVMLKQTHLAQTRKRFRKNPRIRNGTWLVIRSLLTGALELGFLSRFSHLIAFTG